MTPLNAGSLFLKAQTQNQFEQLNLTGTANKEVVLLMDYCSNSQQLKSDNTNTN